jgi:hypothetical protein
MHNKISLNLRIVLFLSILVFNNALAAPVELAEDLSGSYFSSVRTLISQTLSWTQESVLRGCDRLGRWIGSYGRDLQSVQLPNFFEIDYAHDKLFWEGVFNQEIDELKQLHRPGLAGYARLSEMQDFIWHGLLSPYIYEQGLQELAHYWPRTLIHQARDELQTAFTEHPELAKKCFQTDLLESLLFMSISPKSDGSDLQNDFSKMLCYYRDTIDNVGYVDSLAAFRAAIKKDKEKLGLRGELYKDLKRDVREAINQINPYSYDTLKQEQRQRAVEETKNEPQGKKETLKTPYTKPVALIWRVSDRLIQAIITGLLLQSAAVIAIDPFMPPDVVRILSIDGGGIHGVIPATVFKLHRRSPCS